MIHASGAPSRGPANTPAERALDPMVRRVFEASGIAVATLDAEGLVVSATTGFARRLRRSIDEIIGRHLVGMWPEGHRAELTATLVGLVEGSAEVAHVEVVASGEEGTPTSGPRHERVTFGRLTDESGRTAGMVCTITEAEGRPDPARTAEVSRDRRNPSRAARAEPISNELAHLLVGAGNGIDQLLTSALRRSARVGCPIALLRCEVSALDRSAGLPSQAEDRVTDYSNRLFERLRSTDHVIRTSDTTFLVVAQDLGDEQDAAGVAYRLLAAAVEPITIHDRTVTLGMTIGVAVADGRSSASDVVEAAEAALGEALGDGVGGFRLVDLRGGMAA